MNAHLDAVLKDEAPVALVVTGKNKFFSNGHDLAFLEDAAPDSQQAFTHSLCA